MAFYYLAWGMRRTRAQGRSLGDADMGVVRILIAPAILISLGLCLPGAQAQKQGGTLRVSNQANPTSLSIHEEASITVVQSIMAIYSNLVLFDPTVARNSPASIIPELAESWAWDAAATKLTFKLRTGVTWHDAKPFSANDVACTWNRLIDKEPGYFRKNPRRIWYDNLTDVTINGESEVTFHLARPQPSFLSMLASGMSPVYPCHASAKDMRTNPIGTGPFKFVEFKSNEVVRMVRNPNYWKPGRPYLDAVEQRVMPNRSTRVLALIAGDLDMTSPGDVSVPVMKDINATAPQIKCTLGPTNVSSNVLINSAKPPFDNPKLRRAVMLGLDRQGFIDIMSHGHSNIAGVMMALPEGNFGMPKAVLEKLPGYGGTLAERQAEARQIMESLGHGASNKLKIKVSTRDFSSYKEPAVLLVDQLSKMHFEAELETIESTVWFGRAGRQEYTIAFNLTGAAIDDPDVTITENFACKSQNNFTKYCNAKIDQMLDAQSVERDPEKRRRLIWDIERVLAEDVARPIIAHGMAAQCWQPSVKGYIRQENSIYNQWRLEQVWLDK
jgi:peptide/nickel transport system substrate-binding protein